METVQTVFYFFNYYGACMKTRFKDIQMQLWMRKERLAISFMMELLDIAKWMDFRTALENDV